MYIYIFMCGRADAYELRILEPHACEWNTEGLAPTATAPTPNKNLRIVLPFGLFVINL